MATSFNKNSIFNLSPISFSDVNREVTGLMLKDEQGICAFKTVRDQIIFTNKRIIAIDVQGITGMRVSYTSMPYSKIQFFTIQTKGFLEIIPDAELFIEFSNGYTATFEFKGNVDIGKIGRIISEFVL